MSLPISIAIAFDFDEEWSRECLRALLNIIEDGGYFHPFYQKVLDYDAWMRRPEEMGVLPLEKIEKIESINSAKWDKIHYPNKSREKS
jgi:hypothetical protein